METTIERGEVSRQTRRSVEDAREQYFNVLDAAAKEAQVTLEPYSDPLLQFGENIACEGRVVDSTLLDS